MKYIIECKERGVVLIHLTEEVDNIIDRLVDHHAEDLTVLTAQGPGVMHQESIQPKKSLVGIEEIIETSRYSFTAIVGKAFGTKETISSLMSLLDCDIDLDDDDLDEILMPIEDSNSLFIKEFKGLLSRSPDADATKDSQDCT